MMDDSIKTQRKDSAASRDPQITADLTGYWSRRSGQYSKEILAEMEDDRREIWRNLILSQAPEGAPLRILDVGTGPGFFAINLALAGHTVSAVDVTEDMLRHAQKNAEAYGAGVDFRLFDGRTLPFPDGSFDLVISRYVLWNIEEPEEAMQEWKRVLRSGGRMLWFDGNWFLYLFEGDTEPGSAEPAGEDTQDQLLQKYRQGMRRKVGVVEATDVERLALRLPLPRVQRPAWDLQAVQQLGLKLVTAEENLNERIFTGEDLIRFEATPVFMICAEKQQL